VPDVRRYLRQFLSDKRIVDLPGPLWRPILELFVLRQRAPKSAAKYASVWLPTGSPLLVHSQAQVAGLNQRLGPVVSVSLAMRYGNPSLAAVLDRLRADGISRVLVVPMYPQYSTTSTASVTDDVEAYQRARPGMPDRPLEVDVMGSWPADAGYIKACAGRIEAFWDEHGRPDFASGDKLLLSFHGIPVSLAQAGDPYPAQCQVTTQLLRQELGLDPEHSPQTFQSKFGPSQWLKPATIDTVAKFGTSGVRRLDVFCPGFAADCLETDEEIALLNRDAFHRAGGQEFNRIPCLNDDPIWLDALADLVIQRLGLRQG